MNSVFGGRTLQAFPSTRIQNVQSRALALGLLGAKKDFQITQKSIFKRVLQWRREASLFVGVKSGLSPSQGSFHPLF
uniref:Uncharacterized protein n=1 Tax=Lepeophtheirus salmonis TaxID=72036 RepID=A0A0K2TAG1_LEPSM